MPVFKVKFEGKEWEILKDCGSFYVAHIGDVVRNIPKKKEVDGQDSKPASK